MHKAETYFLSILRNKITSRNAFRQAADQLTELLAIRTLEQVPMKETSIETTLGPTTGLALDKRVILIPILRSGITMVRPFLTFFPDALIGVVGLRRDEKTAQAAWYYENIPPIKKEDQIIILDPMIATGGTGIQTLQMLASKGAHLESLIYVSMVSSPEGIKAMKEAFNMITIITAAQDSHLNDDKYIVPGLGDFGDRFFGTE